ncbi:MAG: TldD/PmbA family protein [Candidatus Diapherotrites archaeon]|nr:TldD/PmbA family protein [Candidatus Diapherotrites archaeon]
MVFFVELSLDLVENAKDKISVAMGTFAKKEPALFYADCRLEGGIFRGAHALNGNPKGAVEDSDFSVGFRAFAKKNGVIGMGFVGKQLGEKQLFGISRELKEIFFLALKRAKINAEKKAFFKKKHRVLSEKIGVADFLQEQVHVDKVEFPFKKNPLNLSLEEIVSRAEKLSAALSNTIGIVANEVSLVCGFEKKIFASSSGSFIEQTWPLVEGFAYVAAKGKAVETYYGSLGNFKGLEVLEGENEFDKTFEDYCSFLAEGTIELSNAPAMKTTDAPMTVITDPWFNALLSHEIMGHPSEADRALKREAAWAGRSWWFDGIDDNRFNQQVGSLELSAFSDPSLSGYGVYKYDDEGTLAKKVFHIKNGVLIGFLNSVETSLILNEVPNGGMRAMAAEHVPLVRMNNTAIAHGSWKKEEIFEETKGGYYLVGQKTPSIGETRQNFKITCWKLFKIENGEIGQLYRQGGITGDSQTFFKSIDAVADDFVLHNIPNCGKGTPMQTMRVGNGGPHLRAMAVVSGAH